MQDVFEPTANFGGDVFEPTANFGGEVFEPMNFEGDYSNFVKTPEQLAEAKAKADAKAKAKAEAKASKTPKDFSKIGAGLSGLLKTTTDTITQLAPIMQKPEFQKNLEATCGKSGAILGVGKPRQSYLDCAKNFMEKQGVTNTQFDQWQNSLNTDSTGGDTPPSTGMSMGAKIGLGVVGLAVVGVAVYFIMKGGKKGSVKA